jgi:hypothetical protein
VPAAGSRRQQPRRRVETRVPSVRAVTARHGPSPGRRRERATPPQGGIRAGRSCGAPPCGGGCGVGAGRADSPRAGWAPAAAVAAASVCGAPADGAAAAVLAASRGAAAVASAVAGASPADGAPAAVLTEGGDGVLVGRGADAAAAAASAAPTPSCASCRSGTGPVRRGGMGHTRSPDADVGTSRLAAAGPASGGSGATPPSVSRRVGEARAERPAAGGATGCPGKAGRTTDMSTSGARVSCARVARRTAASAESANTGALSPWSRTCSTEPGPARGLPSSGSCRHVGQVPPAPAEAISAHARAGARTARSTSLWIRPLQPVWRADCLSATQWRVSGGV